MWTSTTLCRINSETVSLLPQAQARVLKLCAKCCIAVQVAEAVHYFGKAQRSNHGVRLAKQHGMDTELLDLALKVPLTSEKAVWCTWAAVIFCLASQT